MPPEGKRPIGPIGILMVLLILAATAIALLEKGSQALLAKQDATGALPAGYAGLARLLNVYLAARYHVFEHWLLYGVLAFFGPGLLLLGVKKVLASFHRAREQMSGMEFRQESYDLARAEFSLGKLIDENPDLEHQVVIGADDTGKPVYLTDRARSMHVHVLGQTGSGKTKSVIEPLMLQDLWRGRGVLFIDGKGSEENEERLAAMAAASGRLADVKVFTLSPFRTSHTYNPLHLPSGGDPQARAELVFSSFKEDMDNPYYRDQAAMFFRSLVCALASTGKRFHMLDVAACIASPDILEHALTQASDAKSRRAVRAQLERLGRKAGETFTGLLAAVQRYDHPAINTYAPDIVLEEEIDRGGVVGFFLPANYYKQLARYIGLVVLQHLQQVGALRQLDRSRSQAPVYVYADEFYSFAYEGFTDALNKLRDAALSLLLSHQTFSDLEKVSKEYAKGVWDNTRNKVVLFQNDPEVCERISKALGTVKGVELTVRRSVDGLLNSYSTLEASSREVDAYRCHPNRIKSLRCGQAYLAQDADFVGVNLQQVPDLPPAAPPALVAAGGRPGEGRADGLGLHDMFVAEGGGLEGAA